MSAVPAPPPIDFAALLALAAEVPIFPCKPDKSPRTPHGFKDATQDAEQIFKWWTQWPDSLVGVPTGRESGLVVVDDDTAKKPDAASAAWLADNRALLESTRRHATRSGGFHYVFRLPDGVEIASRGGLVVADSKIKSVDTRGEGGYIIWWPHHGGATHGAIQTLPAALADVLRKEGPPLPPVTRSHEWTWTAQRADVARALAHIEPVGRQTWIQTGMAIHYASNGSADGFALWHQWSMGALTNGVMGNYQGEADCRYHWESFGKAAVTPVTLASLFAAAQANGYSPAPPITPPPPMTAPPAAAIESPYVLVPPIKWLELIGSPPPFVWWQQDWLSPAPTLASGPGGSGKTRIWQANATALATGRAYIAPEAEPRRILMWLCEDDAHQIWRQQAAINDHFSLTMADLAGRLEIVPRQGYENTLLELSGYGKPAWTPLLARLREQINDLRADVLVLDNLAQVFGGVENDRHQATLFVNGIAGLVRDRPFTPVLLGHVARSAGSEFSGSAAWENAVRMRWYVGPTLPDQKADGTDEAPADPSVTYLARRKANYAAKDWLRMRFTNGLFIPETTAAGNPFKAADREAQAEGVVMEAFRKLQAMGIAATDGRTSGDYLPKQIMSKELHEGHTKKQITDAMNRLMAKGIIARGVIGKYGNRATDRMGLVIVLNLHSHTAHSPPTT